MAEHPAYLQKLIDKHLPAWIEVHKNAKKVDPSDDYHWEGVTVGWAIGVGMKYSQARVFARYIRYSTPYG